MNPFLFKLFIISLPGLTLVGCSGCNRQAGAPARIHLSGQVSYQGQPVPAGRIELIPDTSKGNSGPAGYAEILNGSYDTSRRGKGAVVGPVIAVISGYSKAPQVQSLSDEEAAIQTADNSILFRDYRTSIDLQPASTKQDFKVPVQR